ncbi:MAG TPA: NAD(P)H-hydrate dehydratase [Anaerolineales bacterium]|nr:NAD(P)H-hydrate dehydratase [Anaerolineales bacterium]
MKIVTLSEMLAIERAADAAGHSYAAMIEEAGRSLAEILEARFGEHAERRLLALVGKGNNGGDTLVALEHLARNGWSGSFITAGRPVDDLVLRARAAGWEGIEWPAEDLVEKIAGVDMILDGLLGTGIRLPLRSPAADLLRAIHDALVGPPRRAHPGSRQGGLARNLLIVAVDTPSGIDCDTGEAAPETIPAAVTITMAAAKTGFFKFPAADLIGELSVAGIGLPPDLPEWEAVRLTALSRGLVREWLPERPRDAHKGTFGTAWIAAGSVRYPGAVLLASRAAFRIGAGLVSTACPDPVYRLLAGHFPESTWLPLPDQDGAHTAAGAEMLLDGMDRADALLFGPGFGRAETTLAFVNRLLADPARLPPLVVDADGLFLLTELADWPARLPANTVLTPHPGEMAGLTGMSVEAIQATRVQTAGKYAEEWGQIVVLKGAFTVVAAPDGRVSIVPVASPALARAGTGDVLAGMITGFRAQGLPAYEAAAAGAYVHALAGERAGYALGDSAGVLASDIISEISFILASIRPARRKAARSNGRLFRRKISPPA